MANPVVTITMENGDDESRIISGNRTEYCK